MGALGTLRVLLHRQFVRFLLVGALNTAFGYGCFWLLLYFGLHYALAALLATVLGVMFNFKTTGSLVFRSHDNRLIFRFVASYAVIYVCNVAALGVLVRAGFSPQVAGAMLILPMAFLGFFLHKKFVFAAP